MDKVFLAWKQISSMEERGVRCGRSTGHLHQKQDGAGLGCRPRFWKPRETQQWQSWGSRKPLQLATWETARDGSEWAAGPGRALPWRGHRSRGRSHAEITPSFRGSHSQTEKSQEGEGDWNVSVETGSGCESKPLALRVWAGLGR